MVSHAQKGLLGAKLENNVLIWVLKRNAVFHCACRYQNRVPEILYMQKMVSHVQNGLLGAKIEKNVLIWVIMRVAASFLRTPISELNS